MVDHHQPSDPDPKPVARTSGSELDIVLRWLSEALDGSDEDFAAKANWEAIGWDEDLDLLAERDYNIPPQVVEFFKRWLPRWAARAQRRMAEAAVTSEDGPATADTTNEAAVEEIGLDVLADGVWDDVAQELADASGTWTNFDPPRTKSAEQHRYDLTKLLLLAPFILTVLLLAVVAFGDVQAEDAVTLSAAFLGPLYIPLGIAIAYHYNKQPPPT